MLTIPQSKALIDSWLVKELERISKVLTVADLGLRARQSDVTKVKELIKARIVKLLPAHREPTALHLDTKRIP